MPKLECEFCQKEFTTKSNLNRHQRQAKYCLKLQGVNGEEFICSCGKHFAWSTNLKRHQEVCTFKPPEKSEEVQVLQETVRSLTDAIKELANRPTTSKITNNNNNGTINLQAITNNYLETEGNKHLTEQIVMEGRQPEIAVKIFDGHIIIADKARKKIRYKDEEGNVSTNSRKLVQEFYKAIQSKNKELADKLYGDIQNSVNELIAEDRVADSDFTKLLTAGTNLQDRLMAIKNVADGVIDDNSSKLLDETLKHVAVGC